jgi:hypothetical protein
MQNYIMPLLKNVLARKLRCQDTQHNDIQHSETLHKRERVIIWSFIAISSVIMLNVI